ncbi:MAG: NUDIX domain-containing protein [Phycisphaerales bacterium]|jgi:8-oxo-dGTP pyrophosphatase MutT (NUDIX family)|nr:NUDIX domain-containing protein [Phycisphaerales bacterium]
MSDVSNTHVKQGTFHYIVRGVIRDGHHVLLCKQRTGDYTFLPGGHVEFGEPATVALLRELNEELGIDGVIGTFLGAIENGWDGQFEISLVFEVLDHGLTADANPPPASEDEAHLEFLWKPAEALGEANLLPSVLPEWLERGGWASTL